MATLTFDPNGGDMGRARFSPISPLEFRIILPHIANILSMLAEMKISQLPFKYAFEFPLHVKEEIQAIIMVANLPAHIAFYEIDGRKIFELRGQSGGVTSGLIAYLITTNY